MIFSGSHIPLGPYFHFLHYYLYCNGRYGVIRVISLSKPINYLIDPRAAYNSCSCLPAAHFIARMLSFPICNCNACVLAERSRFAPQALDSPLAHGRRRPRAPRPRAAPVGALSSSDGACSQTVVSRVLDRLTITCPPRSVALSDPEV
eukprot:6205272-Pleurochrysis_carterae.AAC.3